MFNMFNIYICLIKQQTSHPLPFLSPLIRAVAGSNGLLSLRGLQLVKADLENLVAGPRRSPKDSY